MSLGALKALQVLVVVCVIGIIGSFAMSVVTAVKHHHAETQVNPSAIPTPATALSP